MQDVLHHISLVVVLHKFFVALTHTFMCELYVQRTKTPAACTYFSKVNGYVLCVFRYFELHCSSPLQRPVSHCFLRDKQAWQKQVTRTDWNVPCVYGYESSSQTKTVCSGLEMHIVCAEKKNNEIFPKYVVEVNVRGVVMCLGQCKLCVTLTYFGKFYVTAQH